LQKQVPLAKERHLRPVKSFQGTSERPKLELGNPNFEDLEQKFELIALKDHRLYPIRKLLQVLDP